MNVVCLHRRKTKTTIRKTSNNYSERKEREEHESPREKRRHFSAQVKFSVWIDGPIREKRCFQKTCVQCEHLSLRSDWTGQVCLVVVKDQTASGLRLLFSLRQPIREAVPLAAASHRPQ